MLLNPILFSMPFLFFYDSFDLAHSMPSNCFCDSIKGASWGHDSCVGTLSIISYYFCFTLLTCQMYLFYSFTAGIKKKKSPTEHGRKGAVFCYWTNFLAVYCASNYILFSGSCQVKTTQQLSSTKGDSGYLYLLRLVAESQVSQLFLFRKSWHIIQVYPPCIRLSLPCFLIHHPKIVQSCENSCSVNQVVCAKVLGPNTCWYNKQRTARKAQRQKESLNKGKKRHKYRMDGLKERKTRKQRQTLTGAGACTSKAAFNIVWLKFKFICMHAY